MKHRSPFDGAPDTAVYADSDGKRAFIVDAKYLTPLRYQATIVFSNFAGLAIMILGSWGVLATPQISNGIVLIPLLLPWVTWPLIFLAFRSLLNKCTTVELDESQVIIKGKGGDISYDRRLEHKFALLPHDKARIEQIKHDLAVRREASRGRAIAKLPIYGNSYHLSFDYLGQRNDLMTIYGQEEAMCILTRLIACDEVLNAQSGLGEGFSTGPEDDWKASPGDLSE